MTTLSHSHPLSTATQVCTGDELLSRMRAGEVEALADLTRRYGSALTRTAFLQLGDAHAAEDIAQDTLLAAWDGAARTRDDTLLWPWLLGITYNRCRKHWRWLSRKNRREHAASELRLGQLDQVRDDRDRERLGCVQSALAGLSHRLRIVVILRFFEGLSVRETAVALDVPEGTVKRRCHVAINKLREQLGEVST